MLGFLVVLFWAAVFGLPLAVAFRREYVAADHDWREISFKRLSGRICWALGGFAFLVLLFNLLGIWTEVLWFGELEKASRYWTELGARVMLFFLGYSLVLFACATNSRVFLGNARKCTKALGLKWAFWTHFVLAGGLGILIGLLFQGRWQTWLLFFNQQPFGKTDPLFGRDIGFYVFSLPLLSMLAGFVFWTLAALIVASVVSYFILYRKCDGYYYYASAGQRQGDGYKTAIPFYGITHISALGIPFMAIVGFYTWLWMADLLYSTYGAVHGAGWTDIHVQLPAYWVFIAMTVVGIGALAVSVFSSSHHMTRRASMFGFGLMAVTSLLGFVIIPSAVQHWYVSPNELVSERPYLETSIRMTREAYGLDKVQRSDFSVKDGITSENLTRDAETLESARLWDWQVLLSTNHQEQAFRTYYSFADVDLVRYDIGGKKVQVMYSSREMNVNRLAATAQTWQNQHLVYTHGFGGTANPVNTFTSEGLPDYWIKDVPPVSKYPELEMRQPRIYFGEETTNHVYVGTKTKEFDYPLGDQNAWFTYDGPGGIPLGGFLRQFAFAWRFDGLRMLTSSELSPTSRIMFRRDIVTRVRALAPFLRFEDDVYQVVADGRLWFMVDAYTTSEYYPYSEKMEGINYIRNSVKVVVNAYTGKTDFYVFDPADPIIRAWQKVFPGMFQPASAMPEMLKKHIRYPEDLLRIQGLVYANYHMDDAGVFYNKEDAWQFPKQFSPKLGEPETVSPYYVVMAMPGSREREFVLVLPFSPLSTDSEHQRNNMVGWFAARCDGEHYGELVLYSFPKDRLTVGPLQVGLKMNQDDVISKDFTLWNQQGSRVILGDMRVLPLSDSRLLYVQPIYLQSEGGKMPEMKRVVVASGDRLVYGTSFQEALATLAGTGSSVSVETSTAAGGVSIQDLGVEVLVHLDNYLKLLSQGKFAQAGAELEALTNYRSKMKEAKK